MSPSDLTAIANYLVISDRLGTGGQPDPEHFAVLGERGYRVVINLTMPDAGAALPEEGWLVSQHGMVYVHLPIPWEAPTQTHVDTFLTLMHSFRNDKVFVHCIKNFRVAALVYVYRVRALGVDPSIAERDMLRVWRPHGRWASLIEEALGHRAAS